jgi:putative FmdB family regulatory protein
MGWKSHQPQPKQEYDAGRRMAMSQYIYHCQDCNKEFTHQHHMADAGKVEVACPHCGSKLVHQLVAAFSAVTPKKS